MFLVNVKKCLKIFKKVYVSSDDVGILIKAKKAGAIPIFREEGLCGDTPNIPVYQHALKQMRKPRGVVAVQANSPTIKEETIRKVIRAMKYANEAMTCHSNGDIYGSVWAINTRKLENYGDPYKPNPDILILDTSIDIHTNEDYQKALYE